MRINAGVAKGIELIMPRNAQCRPTSDKLKQAVFNSIGDEIIGASVIDLFAGSGSMGLEALSRGANEAVLVEKDELAANAIRENAEKTNLPAKLIRGDVLRTNISQEFDFCFADPPYKINIFGELLELYKAKKYIFEFAKWEELEIQVPNIKPSKVKGIEININGKRYELEKLFKFGIKKAVVLRQIDKAIN